MSRFASPLAGPRRRGFTTIELMIAVIVVGVLSALAFPTFYNSIRKGRRSEAFTALSTLQQAQERYRSTNSTYADASHIAALGLPALTYYTVSIVDGSVGGSTYEATATAVSGTSQANDTGCTLLVVAMNGGNVSYGSGSTATPLTDSAKCWAK